MNRYFDQIHDYIDHRLSPEERSAFEAACKENPELQKMLDHYTTFKELGLGVIDEEVRRIAREEDIKLKHKFRYKLPLLLILIVLFLSGVYYVYHKQKTREASKIYASIYIDPAWPIQRGDTPDTLSDAIRLGLGGNIGVAKKMMPFTSLPDNEKQLWIAELFAKQQMADSVLIWLPEVSANPLQRDRIIYLKIISLYSLGKQEEVEQMLKKLPADTDKVYKEVYGLIK